MLSIEDVTTIAAGVARRHLNAKLQRVIAQPTTSIEGERALGVTLVIEPGSADVIDGGTALDLLVDVQSALAERGDERFATIEYATEADLLDEAAEREAIDLPDEDEDGGP